VLKLNEHGIFYSTLKIFFIEDLQFCCWLLGLLYFVSLKMSPILDVLSMKFLDFNMIFINTIRIT